MLFHFHMVLVQPELLVAPAGGAFVAVVLEFEFLRLLPHEGRRDGHRDLLTCCGWQLWYTTLQARTARGGLLEAISSDHRTGPARRVSVGTGHA